MRVISYDLPPALVDPLNTWLTVALTEAKQGKVRCRGGKYRGRGEYVTSEELRASIDWTKHDGYPVDSWDHDYTRDYTRPGNVALDEAIQREIGFRQPALKVVYAPDGYIAWHDNRNAAGLNVIFTWSDEPALGYWRHVEPGSGEVITIPDVPGWHMKMGLYGRTGGEGDERLQHCATSNGSWRATIGFIVQSPAMWDDIIDEYGDG